MAVGLSVEYGFPVKRRKCEIFREVGDETVRDFCTNLVHFDFVKLGN